jgi:hypothetical protein
MADNATLNNNLNLLIKLTQKMLSNKKVVSSKNTETSKVIDTSMFLSSSVVFQTDLSKQFKILKSDIKKLTNINKELLKSVNIFTKDKKKLKFNKNDDPLDFFKRKRSGSEAGKGIWIWAKCRSGSITNHGIPHRSTRATLAHSIHEFVRWTESVGLVTWRRSCPRDGPSVCCGKSADAGPRRRSKI